MQLRNPVFLGEHDFVPDDAHEMSISLHVKPSKPHTLVGL